MSLCSVISPESLSTLLPVIIGRGRAKPALMPCIQVSPSSQGVTAPRPSAHSSSDCCGQITTQPPSASLGGRMASRRLFVAPLSAYLFSVRRTISGWQRSRSRSGPPASVVTCSPTRPVRHACIHSGSSSHPLLSVPYSIFQLYPSTTRLFFARPTSRPWFDPSPLANTHRATAASWLACGRLFEAAVVAEVRRSSIQPTTPGTIMSVPFLWPHGQHLLRFFCRKPPRATTATQNR